VLFNFKINDILSKCKFVTSKIFTFLILKQQYTILALLIILNIKEKSNGKNSYFFSSPYNKITILALDVDRYRGDLVALSYHPKIRVLFMKQNPPGWLIKPFYSELNIGRYINAEKNSIDGINHKKAYDFMYKFLSIFYKYVSVDCVTTVNYRYLEDYNWSKVSDDLGVPFIMLYRECLLASDKLYDFVVRRKKNEFGKFVGSHIVVHNEKCKQSFIDGEFATSDQVSVAGALRMDNFFKLIRQNKTESLHESKKKFILFYFPHNNDLFGKKYNKNYKGLICNAIWSGRDKLFTDLHNAIIELALEYPDIEFIIKPKGVMVENESWSFYKDVVNRSNIDVRKLPNYRVDVDLNVSSSIIKSSVICALQSSVVVESAFAGKRLILPLFHNFLNSPYFDDFYWKNDLELFDVATDKNQFKILFKDILNNPKISQDVQNKRVELFDRWFSNIKGNSIDKYYNIIKNITQ
jgi:hypothetical protein